MPCQVEGFDLARLILDILECRLPGRKVETGAGGGSHWVPIVFQTGFTPFAWRTGVTCPRLFAGAEYLEAMVRPGVISPGRIGGDRCLGLLTQAVAFPRGILA